MSQRHPANIRIAEAIARCEEYEVEVTPQNVRTNLTLTYDDLTADEAIGETIDRRIRQVMRGSGYVIADTESRERKYFWSCTADELEEQTRIKQEGTVYDQNRLRADEAVISFLRQKERELGYAPFPELFADDIDRLYRMNMCEPPARVRSPA